MNVYLDRCIEHMQRIIAIPNKHPVCFKEVTHHIFLDIKHFQDVTICTEYILEEC